MYKVAEGILKRRKRNEKESEDEVAIKVTACGANKILEAMEL